jgi:hypothetical protein
MTNLRPSLVMVLIFNAEDENGRGALGTAAGLNAGALALLYKLPD